MRLHPTTIEVRRARIGRIDSYYKTVQQQLKDGVTVHIPARSGLFTEQVKHQLKRRGIECTIDYHYTHTSVAGVLVIDTTIILKPAN